MAPSVNFDSNLPIQLDAVHEASRIEVPGLQMVIWPSGFAFTSTAHSGNTLARIDFKYTISEDDSLPAPQPKPPTSRLHC